MKYAVTGLACLIACCAQVTVAPLFPLWSAVPDFVLLTYVLIVAFAGPRPGMVMLPAIALMLGFLSGRSAALVLLAYLPALPLAGWFQANAPRGFSPFQQLCFVTVLTGLWARSLFSFAAMAQGADPELLVLAFQILLPGALLDLAFLAIAYLPIRVFGATQRSLDLQRGGLA